MSAPQITPDQAKFLLAFLQPTLKNEHALTRKVIEAIPSDKGDYRPDPAAKTALELAWHIVASERRFLRALITGAFDFTPFLRPESIRNSGQIAAWFDQMFGDDFAQVEQLSGEQLAQPMDFRGVLRLPAVNFLQVGLNHSIHHRGQLSTYLRPMGSKVPSIYGESYDAAQTRLAKAAKVS